MKKSVIIPILLFLFQCEVLPAQVDRYLKRAENNIERGNLRAAEDLYAKALAKEPNNRSANLGMGLIHSELLENFPEALPYLEKAYVISVSDSAYDLIFALAKCYHHRGEYEKAKSYYGRLTKVEDLEREGDFHKDIEKRISDCNYAIANTSLRDPSIYIVNCGKGINTEMPEYVPVLKGSNELMFTSKRQDSKYEELNYLDGKYFEGMYIVTIESNGYKNLRRYTLPDKVLDSKFYRHNQAVVSLSQDGKKLFTFKDSKLFEVDLDQTAPKEPGEVKIKRFNHYQNHAFLTRDGKTLYFTSDALGGLGGNDIYKSTKSENGEWGIPENIGEPVNTSFDEDAPYIASDGTFYFASKGHEGFGNYDIYKTAFHDGKWDPPENLGQPINSAGHDIFLIQDSSASIGYLSSGRNGGYGDMDIYKLVYLNKINKECPMSSSPAISSRIMDADTSDFKNTIELLIPPNYNILSSDWILDGRIVAGNINVFEHDYQKTGVYAIDSKVIAWCDTCMSPILWCSTIQNKIEKISPPLLVSSAVTTATESKLTDRTEAVATAESVIASPLPNTTGIAGKNSGGSKEKSPKHLTGILSAEQMIAIGFDQKHILFDFNKSSIRTDGLAVLETNITVLKNNPQLYISIKGYADSRGSASANIRISSLRAKVVKNYLLQHGIAAGQIRHVSGKGSKNLLNDCGPGTTCEDALHQINRRVEFEVFSTSEK